MGSCREGTNSRIVSGNFLVVLVVYAIAPRMIPVYLLPLSNGAERGNPHGRMVVRALRRRPRVGRCVVGGCRGPALARLPSPGRLHDRCAQPPRVPTGCVPRHRRPPRLHAGCVEDPLSLNGLVCQPRRCVNGMATAYGPHNPRPGRYTRDSWVKIDGIAHGKGEGVPNRRSVRRSVRWPLSGTPHTPLVTLLEIRACAEYEKPCVEDSANDPSYRSQPCGAQNADLGERLSEPTHC